MKIKIVKAFLTDVEQLQNISRKTFEETYAKYNSAENIRKYLEEVFSADKLKKELNNPDSMFYLAYTYNQLVGYLKTNQGKAQTESTDKQTLEIERIYVLKEFHGKKIGRVLFNKALQLAQSIKATYIWLGVWENNINALGFYKRLGMVEFGKHLFVLGEDKQTDIMMKFELKNNTEV